MVRSFGTPYTSRPFTFVMAIQPFDTFVLLFSKYVRWFCSHSDAQQMATKTTSSIPALSPTNIRKEGPRWVGGGGE